ncbi:acetate/propionate family kinase [Acidithiobacillus sp.]|uniref:acetate/propionate family kinase n=1 Tax=Acidithiobacillus sp. TaxID=1872118 RepID=UPI0026220065|nr:acetate/propionate family kinase [Acidithiobacillus sp.]
MAATRHILCLNSGSSSIKFAVFALGAEGEEKLAEGAAERIGQSVGRLWLQQGEERAIDRQLAMPQQQEALKVVFAVLAEVQCATPDGVGHRIVSGGPHHQAHCLVDARILNDLRAALRFAPLHLPAEIAAIEAVQAVWPHIPQVACFDTAFHQTIPEIASRLPLPRNLWQEGVHKYGFHGLSYEYIVSRLPNHATGKTIIAHLGNGASMAAVHNGQCRDTTMGLTPTGGLVMGTRSGDLDPGVLLYLLEEKGYNAAQLERVLNHLSGLLGISACSGDMQTLLKLRGGDPHAAQAIDIFAYSARKAIGSLMAVLGGLDRLVFTGGIGEHAAAVRWAICRPLLGLGLEIDPVANEGPGSRISVPNSPVEILVIPTNEDLMIARHSHRLLPRQEQHR